MITGHISNYNDLPLPKAIKKALDFLRYTDFSELKAGEYNIDGRKIYAQVIDMKTNSASSCKVESHRRYIDIQFLVKGHELIGFDYDLGKVKYVDSRLPNRDIIFYEDCVLPSTIKMTEGSFAIFFPNDLHQPGIADGEVCDIRKIVVKVDLNTVWDKDYE